VVFGEMERKNLITCNSMIEGYDGRVGGLGGVICAFSSLIHLFFQSILQFMFLFDLDQSLYNQKQFIASPGFY
jgi:hypothetical protein